MNLCLDMGNTDIHGGVYRGDALVLEFRKNNASTPSADEFGLFCLQVLRDNGFDPAEIERVGVASVVPAVNFNVVKGIQKYLKREPLMLQAGIRTGLKLAVKNPAEVGADRIAGAAAATRLYPGRDLIICDFGTATTFDVVTAERTYHGGVIAPGIGLSMRALASGTAKLLAVDIVQPERVVGRDTASNIQSGLYYGAVALAKEVVGRITEENFGGEPPVLVATGGYAAMIQASVPFDAIVSDLVLQGILHALDLNPPTAAVDS